MKLYRKTDGTWAGTQAEAGKGFEPVEVPTDKPGLIAWLNDNMGGATESPAEREEGSVATTEAKTAETPRKSAYTGNGNVPEGSCPRCTWSYSKSKAAMDKLWAGAEADAIAERIEQADGWMLVRLIAATTERMTTIATELKDEANVTANRKRSAANDAEAAGQADGGEPPNAPAMGEGGHEDPGSGQGDDGHAEGATITSGG